MFLHELLAFDQTFPEADWAISSLSLSSAVHLPDPNEW